MLLYEYSSCPAFSQFDWLIIEQDSTILPDGFNFLATLKMYVAHNCLKILIKLRKVMKIEKMLLIKPMRHYFLGNSQFLNKSQKF